MSKTKSDGPKRDNKALQRRMAGKKGQVVQLQTEVNNEEDWEKLLTKEGLIVVDVYSEWCGPCVGMIGNLKKIKVDMGGDSLHLAIAKCDEISALKRFRYKSEPTWMFIGGGQLVNVTFGANAPKVLRMIEAELRQEQRVMRGETWRRSVPFDELCEEEKERMELVEKARWEAERLAAEKRAQELEEKRNKLYTYMTENLLYETIVVCFPHTILPDVGCVMTTELEALFRSKSMYVAAQNKINITPEMCDEIFYRGSMELTEDFLEDLASGPSLALWLKCQIIPAPGAEGSKRPGEIERMICQEVNMVDHLAVGQELVVPDPRSLAAKYMWIKPAPPKEEDLSTMEGEEEEPTGIETTVPGCWTPATAFTKCAACKFLLPTRAEKVMPQEEDAECKKIVIIFDVNKQKECFDLAAENEDNVLNIGYFTTADPTTTEQLCATPEQYLRVPHRDTNKVVVVVRKVSEVLLSFAGIGAVYVSQDEEAGTAEADLFFPPGVEPNFQLLSVAEAPEEEAEAEEEVVEEEELEEKTEDDLMAALGLVPGSID